MSPAGPCGMALGHVGISSRHHSAIDGGGGNPYRTWRLVGLQQHTRQKQFVEQYQESPQKFLESEKARVADFMKIYPQTIIVSAVMMIIAVCVFAFCDKPWLRASALALILVALAALTIDFFSKERGVIYQQELNSVHIEKMV